MQIITSGATRDVILTDRFAIKVPKLTHGWAGFLHGLLANMQERTFSATGWPELCPVRFSIPGGWLLIMHRARPLTAAEWKGLDFATFVDTPDYVVPVEEKISSFGVFGGRIVAVDYGS